MENRDFASVVSALDEQLGVTCKLLRETREKMSVERI
jgi:hypothetical protein